MVESRANYVYVLTLNFSLNLTMFTIRPWWSRGSVEAQCSNTEPKRIAATSVVKSLLVVVGRVCTGVVTVFWWCL